MDGASTSNSIVVGTAVPHDLAPELAFLKNTFDQIQSMQARLANYRELPNAVLLDLYERLHTSHQLMALFLSSLKQRNHQHNLDSQFGSTTYHFSQTFVYATKLTRHVALAARNLMQATTQSDRFVQLTKQAWLERSELEALAAKGLTADDELAFNSQRLKLALMLENDMRQLKPRPDAQMVHAPGFLEDCVFRLEGITRTLNGNIPSIEDTCDAIRQAVSHRGPPDSIRRDVIHQGLDTVKQRTVSITEEPLKTSVARTLCIVWAYISHHQDPDIQANLMQAMFDCLADIASDPTCDVGRAQRIVHVPDGIDPTFIVNHIPRDAIKDDLQTRVARLYHWLDELYENPSKRPAAFSASHNTNNPGKLLGKKITWMQLQILVSIQTAYKMLGIQPSLFEEHLAKELTNVETNELILSDMNLSSIDFSYRNFQGKTALMRLIQDDNITDVRTHLGDLSQQPTHVQVSYLNATCLRGKTAVTYAMIRPSLDMLALLLGNPGLRMDDMKTQPDVHPLFNACRYGRAELLKTVLSSSAIQQHADSNSLNRVNAEGLTALHIAVYCGHHDCLDLLLDQPGCNINIPDHNGVSPLMTAAIKMDVQSLEYLLQHPAHKTEIRVNHTDNLGNTALFILIQYTAYNGHPQQLLAEDYRQRQLDGIALLLAHDALDLDQLDSDGQTALQIAQFMDDEEIERLIMAEIKTRTNANSPSSPLNDTAKHSEDSDTKRQRIA